MKPLNYTAEGVITFTGPEPRLDTTELWVVWSDTPGPMTGSGTEADPMVVSSAGQFDSVLVAPDIKTFRLGPGTFMTLGSWTFPTFCVLPDGGAIIGSGIDATTIKLDPAAIFATGTPPVARDDANVLWLGTPHENNSGFLVSDLTIDGNMAAFAPTRLPAGLTIWGNDAKILRVRVKNIRGDFVRGLETFGIACRNRAAGNWSGPDGGSLIQDCVVEDVAPNAYVSAIYPGYEDFGRVVLPTVVERCTVRLGGQNQACYSFNCDTDFLSCYGSGAQYGFYNDTGNVDRVGIDRCKIEECRVGLSMYAVGSDALRKNGIIVSGSSFALVGTVLNIPIGVEMWDQTNDSDFANHRFSCNTYMVSGTTLVAISVLARWAKIIEFKGNVVPLGTTQNIAPPTPPTSVVVEDNWLADGTLVPGAFVLYPA